MSDKANDIALVERYVGGDMDAFDELVRAHRDRVFAVCLRMLKDRDAALDATQDTFVTLFRKADRYRAEAAFTTWLYRVTMNVCYDHLRRSQRRRTEPLPESADPADPSSEDSLCQRRRAPRHRRRARRHPPRVQGQPSYWSISRASASRWRRTASAVPIGTVKSRLFRGRRLLAATTREPQSPGTEHQREE